MLNVLGVLVLMYHTQRMGFITPKLNQVELPEDSYRFRNPKLAYYILTQLDEFEPVPDTTFNLFNNPHNVYNQPYLSLAQDEKYCSKVRAHFIDNPTSMMNQYNIFTEYDKGSLVREKIIKRIGKDMMKNLTHAIPDKVKKTRTTFFSPKINLFYTIYSLHPYQHLGKHYACLYQQYNHIPGQGTLNRKDMVAESIWDYAEKYKTRPHCFNYDKAFPETWSLRNKEQCQEFFDKYFNTQEYQELKKKHRIVFIRKIGFGAHRAEGVQPVNEEEEAQIREMWGNGTKCGTVKKNYLMQRYILNPLLLDGHKFDFRLYMIVASTNPLILYYHDGFLRVSLHKYDVTSNDKSVLLTNTELSKELWKKAAKGEKVYGMNETELRNFQMWNLTRLQDYLLKVGKIKDPNWLDNYLRPEFKKAMVHLLRATSHAFLKRSQVFELFGIDFMLDDNLNLWFIECNSGPVLKGTSEEKERFLTKMLLDQFEIVFGYLKSRLKRIIRYTNQLIREEIEGNPGLEKPELSDIEEKRKVFKEITKNYFEPEFEPSPTNGFVKIIDENLDGTERYAGLISKECL